MSEPMLIVCMGVSGTGKTTLGKSVADARDWQFIDADDLHSEQAIAKMAAGQPLTDADRAPWMRRVVTAVQHAADGGDSIVLAHSGLREHHRDQLRRAGLQTHFLFLNGLEQTIHRRLQNRQGHFMPSALLASQLSALQSPLNEPDVTLLDCAWTPDQLLQRANHVIGELEVHSV
ncbi:MAG: gluconokinase, GntK/IdnK-type [Pseudomonadota bacterium]